MSESLLSIDDLSTELSTEVGVARAVDALTLSIDRRETFALVGESGCGKSMTAMSLLRLLPENGRIASGSIRLNGEDLCALRELDMQRVRGARIGIIFQEPATSLNPVMRVGRQIVEVIERHTEWRGDAARQRAIQWLDRVGLPDAAQRFEQYPFQMSGGQKQRVMIALALAAEPDLLIADEPTTALDVTIQGQILALLMQLQRDQGMGLLLITHDLGIVRGMAHRVALMYAGQIVEVADTPSFFARPGHPYAQRLLKALPGASPRGEALAAIPGTVPALTGVFPGCRFVDRCDRAVARCATEPPALGAIGGEHLVRCWLAGPQGAAATEPSPLAESPAPDESPAPSRPSPVAEAPGSGSALPSAQTPVSSVVSAKRERGDWTTTIERAFGRERVGRTDGTAPPSPASSPIVDALEAATPRLAPVVTPTDATPPPAPPVAPIAADAPLLEVRGLVVRFPVRGGWLMRAKPSVAAVQGVSFDVPAGRTLALVGESGCGKTTIGKAMLQLLRGVAQIEGQARLQGQDLFTLHGDALRAARRDIQIIFQDPFASLNPRLRVLEVLEEGMVTLLPRLSADERRSRIESLVDRVGLRRDSLDRYPHEFSGGQRQRIAIARALAVSPRLIVCDEPTSALDVSVQAQILNLLRELQRDLGMSYLFITHNIGVVETVADQVAVMRAGRFVEHGPTEQVLKAPAHEYTRSLMAAVPRIDGPFREPVDA